MFINKLNQLYKPKRILYYIDASESEINALYNGIVCDSIKNYTNAFGTYDYPGVFFLSSLEKPVIGIEYRLDDKRIKYPENLKSIVLDEAFFYSIEIDNEIEINLHSVKKIFEKIAEADDAHRQYSDLSIKNEPGVISIFGGGSGKKIRILYEWKLDDDRAKIIINNDIEKLDKEHLYKMSFIDPITNHYNWNHLVPFLEMPMDNGIMDYAFVHFDVKEFRVINEVYGHIAENKILSNIVRAMKESDFVYASCRCHNDNFAMMIKDMPQEQLLEKLQKFFEDLSYLEEDPNYKIYYRCGVVPTRFQWMILVRAILRFLCLPRCRWIH